MITHAWSTENIIIKIKTHHIYLVTHLDSIRIKVIIRKQRQPKTNNKVHHRELNVLYKTTNVQLQSIIVQYNKWLNFILIEII